jgi:hypothetical protein
MPYRVKNISDTLFSFEGLVLQPGEVSGELLLDVYQRVLALNYGSILMPVEDGEIAPEPVVVPVAVVEPVAEVVVEIVPEEPPAAVAAEPQVEAPKKRGRPRKNL